MALTRNQATLVGCTAPIFWGLSVSIVRTIAETIGITAGLAINYLLAFIFVFLIFRFPNFKKLPLKYYVFGLGAAVSCSFSFAYSLHLAKDATQTMEVGMVNYLWPSLTVLFAVLFNKQKARWWIGIGILTALYGVMMIISNRLVVDFAQLYNNILTNPFCYFLALVAAVSWSSYSNFTSAWARGENPTAVIFGINAIFFNVIWASGLGVPANFSWEGISVVVISALVMGGAYGLWTYGVQKGSIALLGIASYFTPVLSCFFASILIGAKLTPVFWVGVAVVVLGSFICYLSMRSAGR